MKNIKFEILKFISENPKNLTIEVLCDNFKELSENEIFDYLVEFRDEELLKGFFLVEFDQCAGRANFYKPKLTENGEMKLTAYIQENSKLIKTKRKIVLSWKVASCIVGIVTGIIALLANLTTTINSVDKLILWFKNF